uniref:Uncharacterized protein n=1 Tax=Arundo donax TaxID=35708 RepID=A0A0A9F6N9_ARUDO
MFARKKHGTSVSFTSVQVKNK